MTNFHFSTLFTYHSPQLNPNFHKWNGKQNDTRSKVWVGFWWDEFQNSSFHHIPKFTFWSRKNDDSKKSRGVPGRGLGWQQVGSIPPISNFIPPLSHQEVYYKTALPTYFDVLLGTSRYFEVLSCQYSHVSNVSQWCLGYDLSYLPTFLPGIPIYLPTYLPTYRPTLRYFQVIPCTFRYFEVL